MSLVLVDDGRRFWETSNRPDGPTVVEKDQFQYVSLHTD